MNYIFDRDIMRWFDHLFEKHTNTFLIDNFICNMYDRARPVDKENKVFVKSVFASLKS